MDKPRIFKFGRDELKCLICISSQGVGHGETPYLAWKAWLQDVLNKEFRRRFSVIRK